MPIYHQLGKIPPKRHTQYRQKNGKLYHEELFGMIGFDGMSSLIYHLHPPTEVVAIGTPVDCSPKIAVDKNLQSRKLIGFDIPATQDYLQSRKPLLVNSDVIIGLAAPKKAMTTYFYKNADADELIFIHTGKGLINTPFGSIAFQPGDYLVIPRGVIYQIHFEGADNRIFYLESFQPIYTPKRYRNHFGQLLEHSPFCERDYKLPSRLTTIDQKGVFWIKIKKDGMLHALQYQHHPFDVIGWDGYNYPYGFSIHNFEPITGRIHLPPPIHQTFETTTFVVCSFCPRLYDYHPEAIPAPYNHSNIDSDEVLYYVGENFMSRKDIRPGHLSLHPAGIPHGPHPGTYEGSIGKKETRELAVMVDTFKPLQITETALEIEHENYFKSWSRDE